MARPKKTLTRILRQAHYRFGEWDELRDFFMVLQGVGRIFAKFAILAQFALKNFDFEKTIAISTFVLPNRGAFD